MAPSAIYKVRGAFDSRRVHLQFQLDDGCCSSLQGAMPADLAQFAQLGQQARMGAAGSRESDSMVFAKQALQCWCLEPLKVGATTGAVHPLLTLCLLVSVCLHLFLPHIPASMRYGRRLSMEEKRSTSRLARCPATEIGPGMRESG